MVVSASSTVARAACRSLGSGRSLSGLVRVRKAGGQRKVVMDFFQGSPVTQVLTMVTTAYPVGHRIGSLKGSQMGPVLKKWVLLGSVKVIIQLTCVGQTITC